MNWFDFVQIAILASAFVAGVYQGLIRQLISVLAVIASFYLALRGSGPLAALLEQHLDLSTHLEAIIPVQGYHGFDWLPMLVIHIVAFLLLFALLQFVARGLTGSLKWLNRVPLLGPLNALGGGLLGAFKGLLLITGLVALISLIPTPFWLATAEESAITALIQQYMPLAVSYISDLLLDFFLQI